MTKGEFLYNLRCSLSILPKEEIENIIQDYSMHINELLDEGQTLEEILIKLGDPKEIAKQYIDELGYKDSIQEVNQNERQYDNTGINEKKKNVGLFIFMQFINFFILVWILFGIAAAVFSVGVSGVAVAGSSFAVLLFNNNTAIGIKVLEMFVLVGVGVLLFNAALAIAILIVKLMIKYVRWNISLIS